MSSQPASPLMAPDTPVGSVADLVAHFQRGEKPEHQFRIGVEHEKIAVVVRPGEPVRPLPYEDPAGGPGLRDLLTELTRYGWTAVEEDGRIIGLRRHGSSVSLEPGGQMELSGRPFATAVEAARDVDLHMAELLPIAAAQGVAFLACGFRPLGSWDDVPWMPKGRYRVMRMYLPTRGKLGVEMMKRTATVQVNLDYHNEADAMEKLRLAMSLSPLITAMYAASPLRDGRPCGYKSFRAACWLDTDPDRCGLLPFVYHEGAGYRDYVEWALDVPMFFVYRQGTYHPVLGLTFRRFLHEGWQGERATLGDWDLHLSTLFPEARLRQYVETRSADAGPMELVRALPCLWRGLLYSAEGSRAAWELVRSWSYDERQALRREVPRAGMEARVRGHVLGELCEEVVNISREALRSLGDEEALALLEPLCQLVRERRAPAEALLSAYTAAAGDERAFVEAIRYR
ncbi:MAG: glutamate-cysteine ligase family protein [Myxococcales bacterium]|nr:glutamate-cysteine ligase family protein [Myxococcota bacterium]MDW8282581.1 glutamate-cysteine ligase family protein [Myxococcales bacterium]